MRPVPPRPFARVAARAVTLPFLACLLATCNVAIPSEPAASSSGSTGGSDTPASPGSATVAPPPSRPIASPSVSGDSPGAASATPAVRMGGHVAVLLASDGSSRLQIVGPDGVTGDAAPPAGAVLAIAAGPDGRLVARDAGGRLWLTAGPAGSPGQPRMPDPGLTWSPLAPRSAVAPALPGLIVGITWDADGQRLLALAADPGGADERIGLIAIRAVDGASAVTIVRARPGGSLAWSLARSRRVFVARTRADQAVVATADGESVVLLDVPAYDVAFSGDRSVAAILAPDGAVRTGTTDGLLAGRIPGAAALRPAETEAAGFALDATGEQLAVAWRSTDGADGSLVAYRAIGGAWTETLRIPFAATAETATPAWIP